MGGDKSACTVATGQMAGPEQFFIDGRAGVARDPEKQRGLAGCGHSRARSQAAIDDSVPQLVEQNLHGLSRAFRRVFEAQFKDRIHNAILREWPMDIHLSGP